MDNVENPGDPEFVDAAQPHRARQDLANFLVGQRPVRVHERQRNLPIQRRVERLPELQVQHSAVEDQEPVAAAGDAGAGNKVRGILGRWWLHSRFARCVELAVGPGRFRRRHGSDLKIGRHVGLEIIDGR